MNDTVYLDHAATTPLHPAVLDAMLPFLKEEYGNPSASYGLASIAASAIDRSRESVAEILGCTPNEITFTSGGTESVNSAIKGVAFAQQLSRAGNQIVTSAIEHHAVLHSCQYLEKFEFDVHHLSVDQHGLISPDEAAAALGETTVLVSVMLANNETGVIQPLEAISAAVRSRARELGRQVPIHTDAIQGANALNLDVDTLSVDLLSLSSHKFGGPKGNGILYVRRGTPFLAQQSGGGQERQRRAGTENVAGIVGTAKALELAHAAQGEYVATCSELRDALVEGIIAAMPDTKLNGHPQRRLPNSVNVSFPESDARKMLDLLDEADIAASAGSACNEDTIEPSHVLLAMDVPLSLAAGTLRFTVGRSTTRAEIDRLLTVLPSIVQQARTTTATPAG